MGGTAQLARSCPMLLVLASAYKLGFGPGRREHTHHMPHRPQRDGEHRSDREPLVRLEDVARVEAHVGDARDLSLVDHPSRHPLAGVVFHGSFAHAGARARPAQELFPTLVEHADRRVVAGEQQEGCVGHELKGGVQRALLGEPSGELEQHVECSLGVHDSGDVSLDPASAVTRRRRIASTTSSSTRIIWSSTSGDSSTPIARATASSVDVWPAHGSRRTVSSVRSGAATRTVSPVFNTGMRLSIRRTWRQVPSGTMSAAALAVLGGEEAPVGMQHQRVGSRHAPRLGDAVRRAVHEEARARQHARNEAGGVGRPGDLVGVGQHHHLDAVVDASEG